MFPDYKSQWTFWTFLRNPSKSSQWNHAKASGVHSHLPIDQIFANIGNLKWDHVSLLKYLFKVKDELSKSDVTKLKSTYIPRYSWIWNLFIIDLYADSINPEIIRIFKLKFLNGPQEFPGRQWAWWFLTDFGFNYTVPWRILLKGVGSAQASDRAIIFKYFLDNFSFYEDYSPSKVDSIYSSWIWRW